MINNDNDIIIPKSKVTLRASILVTSPCCCLLSTKCCNVSISPVTSVVIFRLLFGLLLSILLVISTLSRLYNSSCKIFANAIS